jgi:hypothetical protein
MDNNKILAQYLYDMAKESKSEFIEISKDSELIKVAEKMNLVIPSPDIAILRTIYAEVDKPNRNNIVLPKEAAKKALPTLIGKQANWSHKGKNYVCGWILDAKLEKDVIITHIAIYKSLFAEEFEKMKEMVKENKMASSFEIWNRNPENGEPVLHDLGNGIKSIDPIIYHGIGILIEGETPACPKAYADKLLAIFNYKELNEAEKIVDKVFEENLCYAQLAIEEPKCRNCSTCTCIKDKEEKIMIKCEKCGKDFESSAEEKICVECASLPKEEPKTQLPEEIKAEVKPEETKPVDAGVETKPVETKAEVTPEIKAQEMQVIEPKIVVKVTRIYSEVSIDTYVDGTPSGTSIVKGYNKRITEYKDGTKDEVEEEIEIKKKYDFAELEEKVNAAKTEKDAEIATLKAEQERILVEKDKEITTMKQELGTKDQEIAKLTVVEEPKVEKILTVGSVESETISEIKRQANNINEIIASKNKK